MHPAVARLILLTVVLVPLRASEGQARGASASEIASAVDSLANRAVAAGMVPALGVAIVMDGRTILARNYGMADATRGVPVDDRTLWYVASTSKSFTGFAVSLLAERGRMRIDQPITELLPDVTWHPSVRADSLDLRRFMSHTFFLQDDAVVLASAYTGAVPEREWPRLLRHATPSASRDLRYSNFGYIVAAMVIDRVSGGGWRRFVEEEVFRPAGMHETYARVSGIDQGRIARPHVLAGDGSYVAEPFTKGDVSMNSAGGHLSTIADLARWATVQMDSGRIDGRQVFPRSVVARSHAMLASHTVEASRRFAYFDREGWGSGWDIGSYEGERMVSRFGGWHTARSHLSFLPDRRIGVVSQATGGLGGTLVHVVAALAYDLEAGRPDARTRADARLAELVARLPAARAAAAAADSARRAALLAPRARPDQDFVGRYGTPEYGTLQITESAEGLRFRFGTPTGRLHVTDAARNAFTIYLAGASAVPMKLEFGLSEAGPARFVVANGRRLPRLPQ